MNQEYIGKYRIDERLGSGTFATVYRCYDHDLDSVCAIKVLAENWSEDESARSWFLNEARVMFGIEHPAILRIFTSGSLDDGRPYFVMEYAEQGSLADQIRERRSLNRRFETAEALEISIAIADGLNVAHSRGLVHRDLKPSNILFRNAQQFGVSDRRLSPSPPEIKLADFGLARRLEQGANSLAGAGTPHYIAPEQARGLADERPDVRNDIYSAATILYELLAGQVPFPYKSMTQVIAAHLNEEPAPVQELAPHVPDEIASLIHAGLAKDPDARISTAIDWRQRLQVLRTALNADGTIAGWGTPVPAIGANLPDTRPAADRIENQEAPTVQAGSLTETRVQRNGYDSDPVEEAESSDRRNAMVPYIFAALAFGLVVVGLLGFALTDLVTGADNSGTEANEAALITDGSDNEPEPSVSATPEITPADEPDAVAEPTPTPTRTPEPTPEPSPSPEPTEEPETSPVAEDVAVALQGLPGLVSSVVVLPAGEIVDESGDRQVAAASTIKLWIAATAYEQIANGDLDADAEYTIQAEDQASGTGILNQGQYVGRVMTIDELIEIMLLYSDNSAANIIIERVGGLEQVNEYARDHGYPDTRMQRFLGALDPDRENYTSAEDGARFMERLLDDRIVDRASSVRLRSILERRSANDTESLDFFGRELPPGATYAHISGLIPGVRNEIGYFQNPHHDGYVVVSFMLAELPDEARAEQSIAAVVAEINAYLDKTD